MEADWRRIEEIFEEVVALPEEEREARLAELCEGDETLRTEVLSLLAADDGASQFLERPPHPTTLELPPPSATGRRFGPWRVERLLGEGGMASVHLGVRDDGEFRQQVAIKIYGYAADRADLVERFRAERQILASLDHPNIARLLDGGTTEDGLPYLVMEYIDGVPIDRFCTERELGIDARIDLFRASHDASPSFRSPGAVLGAESPPSAKAFSLAAGQVVKLARRAGKFYTCSNGRRAT